MAHSRSSLAKQKAARNAIVGAENLLSSISAVILTRFKTLRKVRCVVTMHLTKSSKVYYEAQYRIINFN